LVTVCPMCLSYADIINNALVQYKDDDTSRFIRLSLSDGLPARLQQDYCKSVDRCSRIFRGLLYHKSTTQQLTCTM